MAERRPRGRRKQREGEGVSQRRPRGVFEVSQRSQRCLGGASTPHSWPRERSSRKSHSSAAGTSRTAAPARSTATSSGYVGACHWGHVQKATGPDTQPAAPLSSCRPARRRLPTHTAALNRRGSRREGHARLRRHRGRRGPAREAQLPQRRERCGVWSRTSRLRLALESFRTANPVSSLFHRLHFRLRICFCFAQHSLAIAPAFRLA